MAYALEISGLTKIYDNGFQALNGIDLNVASGDFFALLGPNGAGKSTTLGIVSSLVNKTEGSVKVNGFDLDTQREQVKRSLGVVPQEFNFNTFEKVIDIVVQQAGYYGLPRKVALERAEKYLKQLDLWEKRDVQSRMLSGGMKRRLMIARALMHEPKILILDEPTAGVDIEIRRTMWTFLTRLNQQGTTIILTTHYLEEAESLCRNLAIIGRGDIIARGATKELLKEKANSTFVVDLHDAVTEIPEALQAFGARVIDDYSLEFSIQKGASLNRVFDLLNFAGINAISIRPKTNRLEELFVDLTGNNAEQEADNEQ
ncbi:ABC transporter ATP-binding protein [Reinekea marinisedimentorum]|uniref:ABC-2 type transport system ATP-binding protein n=1 Tax=Reinekea marinisedimentorum TaxID=230495 RepID=A0A4R3I3G1_9GAMM|nr:ABC transporter ATP-binding protein [Reinekea marinisedimentorum]TCS40114.1 ABC-2 type transport system ATP-binding protein [Reinekea marinisedimentorum]